MKRAYMNWSGGKDSSLCLYKALQDQYYRLDYLLTSVNAAHNRISMHGVRRELLLTQANAIGIPLTTIELPEQPDMEEYEECMRKKIGELKSEGLAHAFFGDIFLEDLRKYREQKLQEAGITCSFPLWKISTTQLMKEFIELGFKAIIVCVNEKYLDKSFCGRLLDESFMNDIPANVDVCGENGEFHSFVFDGPIFREPVSFTKGETVRRMYTAPQNANLHPHERTDLSSYGFYFHDLLPI